MEKKKSFDFPLMQGTMDLIVEKKPNILVSKKDERGRGKG
jgi:hypothetical protein